LVTLRSQHLAMVSSLFAFVIAFSFIPTTKERGLQPAWGVLVLFGTTALALYEISSTQKRMGVAPPDERTAARGYPILYFIRVGMVLTPALAGFALFFVGGGRWVYLAGVSISEVLLWLIAPSRANLSRLTERYRAQGKNIDLTSALLTVDPPQDGRE